MAVLAKVLQTSGLRRHFGPPVRHPTRLALIFILLLIALALGTLVAAAWEAIDDMQARGQMDPTW